jgi:hypothetical protein
MTALTWSPTSLAASSAYPGGMTSSTSSTPGAAANAVTQCSTSVFPPRVSSCLGIAPPNRFPAPPPRTTATTRVTVTWGLYSQFLGVVTHNDLGRVSTLGKQRASCTGGMRMTPEELAADQRAARPVTDPVARDVARWASSLRVRPVAMSSFSVGFGVIAAVWLTRISFRAEAAGCAALLAAFIAGRAGRLMAGDQAAPATEWGQAACAVLTELVVYAGIAGGASANAAATAGTGLTGALGEGLRGTFLAGLGGSGAAGVWHLAVAAVIALALLQMTELCLPAPPAQGARSRRLQALIATPGDERLLLIGGAVLLAGARATFLLLLAACMIALGALVVSRFGSALRPARLAMYRDDGPISIWIGRFVDGRLPPLPPLLVGLLVTGVLSALGLQNLPGILVLTPVEAMMLAALGSWHSHDGRSDWLVPPLLQAGEYVFLAALGIAGRVWPPTTLALLAAVAMRHLEVAYWARNGLRPGADRRGLGWECRMIVAGIAAVGGVLPIIYPLLALYLWGLLAWDWLAVWSA